MSPSAAALLTALLLAPELARSAWKTEQVAEPQIGDFASGAVGGNRRLFLAADGNIHDGSIYELSFGSAGWANTLIYRVPKLISNLEVTSGCDASNELYGTMKEGETFRLKPGASDWTSEIIAESTAQRDPLRGRSHLTMVDGSSSIARFHPSAGGSKFVCGSPRQAGAGRVAFRVLVSGDLRGDGRIRFYGIFDDMPGDPHRGAVIELTPGNSGWNVEYLTPPSPFSAEYFVIGDLRGNGRLALYGTYGRGVIEIRWNGVSWENTLLSATGIAAGIAMGEFRRDGRKRLYVADGVYVREFTFMDDAWRMDILSPHVGVINHFSSALAAGRTAPELFLSVMNRAGFHRLIWDGSDRIAVIPFGNDNASASEAAAFGDLLVTKFARMGNCEVIERERIDALLTERRLRASEAMSPENTLELGRLLNAKKVVVGNVGKLFDSWIASVNAVSIHDGTVRRSKFSQWEMRSDLMDIADSLARDICPAQDGEE